MALPPNIQLGPEYEVLKMRRFAETVWGNLVSTIARIGLLEERSRFAIKEIDSAVDTTYAVLIKDFTVIFDCTTAGVTASLPAAPPKPGYMFRLGKIDASNNLTVSGNGKNINGSATHINSTQNEFNDYQWTGTEWFIVSST